MLEKKDFLGSATPCAFPAPRRSIFSIILFGSPALLTRMTGITLHMQWLLTSQPHGSEKKDHSSMAMAHQGSKSKPKPKKG
jgi:hypothetical protein